MRTIYQLGYEFDPNKKKWIKVRPEISWESLHGLPESGTDDPSPNTKKQLDPDLIRQIIRNELPSDK
jgi:hypothetical protein